MSHPRSKKIVIFIWLFLFGLPGFRFAASGQIVVNHQITHYGSGKGLDQGSVKNAAVDAWGYVWLATQSGLVRFDGRNFKSFNSSDILGLSNDRIGNVGVTANGHVWAQTVNNQFITISQTDKYMTPVPVVSKNYVTIPVTGFARENDREMVRQLNDISKSGDQGVALTACTGSGEAYVIHHMKVFYVHNRKSAIIDDIPIPPKGKPLNLSFTVTNDDVYIQVFAGNYVKAWQHGKRLPEITRLEGDLVTDQITLPYNAYSLLWSKNSSVLYVGRNIYRVIYKNGRIITERAISGIDIAKGLSAIHYLEGENKYIVCSRGEGGGISVVQPALFSYPTPPVGIRSRSFYSQHKVGPNELFARNFVFSQNANPVSLPAGTDMNDDYRTGYFSEAGNVYFQNNQNLIKYNRNTGKSDTVAIMDDVMKAMLPDKYRQDLLFCTKRSINRIQGGKVTDSWKIPWASPATTFLQIDQTHFLAGTENGLKWFSTVSNKIERSVLDSSSIWSLYREQNGNIWIGTYGKGFYLFDGKKLVAFPLGPGNALKTVHSFIDDGHGSFWLPSNDGLFKVSKKDLLSYAAGRTSDVYFFRFDRHDGLTNNEFNGGSTPSHVWLADSMLSLPAIDGLVWFYPKRFSAIFPKHPILVEKLILDGRTASTAQIANLPAGSHTIELQINTPYLGNLENLRLDYQISGYSNEWQVVPQDGKILLQNFPAGSYNLMFRKRKNDDPSQYDRLEIPFRIAPFFYNTIWFYTLLVLGITALAYLFTRWRTRNLELVAKRLEERIKERTHVLNNTVVQLEESRNQLRESDQIKDKLVSMVLHDLRSPIRFLDMMGTRLIRNHRDLDKDILTERIVEIGNGASSLYSYVNQFLTWTSTQHGLYKVRQRWVALAPLFAGISELYSEIARYHQNTLTLDHGDIQCHTDPDLLMAILRNLVDNAMKYTSEGNISLIVEESGDEVKISVADTGTGMNEAQIAVFYGKGDQETHAGLGSTLVRDLLQKLEGRLLIESVPNKGTTITIHLMKNPDQGHNSGQG